MKVHSGMGVFALGAMMGTAAAVTVAMMDPAVRRVVRTKAVRMSRRAIRTAGTYFR